MPRLLLIRHAPTATTGRKLTGRLPGHPLTPAGKEMAAGLAERLAGTGIDALYSSPLLRCRQTARPIGRAAGVAVSINRAFTEVDYGDWSGRSLAQLRRLRAWSTVVTAPSRVRFPGGESLGEAAHRALAGCEALGAHGDADRVAVVSHADIIKLILSHFLGQPLDLFQRLVIGPASVSVVDLPRRAAPKVVVVNHMPGGGL